MKLASPDFTPWPAEYAQLYRTLGYWQGETFGQWMSALAHNYGANIALRDTQRSLSYQALDQQSTQLAYGFYQHGLRKGDRVVVQLPNCIEFFEVFFALLKLGVQAVLALPAHRNQEISFFCKHTEAKAYITSGRTSNHPIGFDHLSLARAVISNIPSTQQVFVVGSAQEFISLDTFSTAPAIDLPVITADEVAFFQLSGGSTGTPKLIPRTHDDYLYSVRASAEICQLNRTTVYLAVLPLAHNFSLSSPGSLGVLQAGGTVVIAPDPSPETAFPLLRQHQVTFTSLVPSLLLVWLQAAAQLRLRFPELQTVQVGGAPLSADTAKQVPAVLGCALQQVFGMAEGLVNYTRLTDAEDIVLHTQGRPISPHDQVRIVNDADQDVPDGQSGHLLIRGPYTIRGYFRAAEHNQRAFTSDGFYRSGDIVRRRPDGYLQVTGRHKDQINRGGEKIAAEEIEAVLLQHPMVQNVAVVGYPDHWLGERSCAFVQYADIQYADIQDASQQHPKLALELKRHVRWHGLADHKIPDRIEFVAALPQTAFGKIDKPTLRQQLSTPQEHTL